MMIALGLDGDEPPAASDDDVRDDTGGLPLAHVVADDHAGDARDDAGDTPPVHVVAQGTGNTVVPNAIAEGDEEDGDEGGEESDGAVADGASRFSPPTTNE